MIFINMNSTEDANHSPSDVDSPINQVLNVQIKW